METLQRSNIEIRENDVSFKKQNDLHVSVITPLTKRIVHCTETKVKAFYKPVDLVENVNIYVAEGDKKLVEMYKEMKEKKLVESKKKDTLLRMARSKNMRATNGRLFFHKSNNVYNKKDKVSATLNNRMRTYGHGIPEIDTVFVPKFEKNVEIVSHMNEHVNVDFTYMIPKPVVIPVEVPVLKFKDHYQIIPVRKTVFPVIKYSDEVIYVDCYVEKPYLVLENVVVPVPCDVPIKQNKYIDKVPPITNEETEEESSETTKN